MSDKLAELEPLMSAQERLDDLASSTFRRFGPRTADFSYANAYGGPRAEVRRELERAVWEERRLIFQYSPFGGRTITRRIIASHLKDHYGLAFGYRNVIMTPGAMAGLNLVFQACCEAGDEIVVLTPCWHDYPLYLQNLNIPCRMVPLRRDKRLDLDAIAGALNENTRGVLLSQPCCPTGVLYSKQELASLSKLLATTEARFDSKIYLISDEVHRRVIWSGAQFHSPLHSHPRSFCIYSFGKRLLLQGQRTGYVAVSPEMPEHREMSRRLERWARVTGFCTPTDLMQRAVCGLLEEAPEWDPLRERQHQVREALSAYGYEICPAQATFFVYVRSPIADDFRFAEEAAAEGVLVVPSTLFHEKGYFRLSLAGNPDTDAAPLDAFDRLMDKVSPEAAHARVAS